MGTHPEAEDLVIPESADSQRLLDHLVDELWGSRSGKARREPRYFESKEEGTASAVRLENHPRATAGHLRRAVIWEISRAIPSKEPSPYGRWTLQENARGEMKLITEYARSDTNPLGKPTERPADGWDLAQYVGMLAHLDWLGEKADKLDSSEPYEGSTPYVPR